MTRTCTCRVSASSLFLLDYRGRWCGPAGAQSQRSVLTGDLRAYETREVTIPPHCVLLRVVRPRVNEENRTPCSVGHDHLPLHPAPSTMRAAVPECIVRC